KIQDKAERVAENNKRKWESNNNQSGNNNNINNYRDNTRHYQHNNKRQRNARAITTTLTKQGGYARNKPFCNRCKKHHTGYCTVVCSNYGRTGHMARDCKSKAVATGANAQPILTCYECGEKGHTRNHCPKRNNPQGELGTFDIVIGMDWLVELDAVIVCGKKKVHIPVKNKVLVVKGNEGVSRLKVISCIKVRKYVEKGSQLFLAHMTEKEPSKRRLEDVSVVCEFLEVFHDDLPRLPPPRQVEFRIELVPGAATVARAPVTRAPYCLAPSEMKELSN
ncbi:putative reverse transcriptase domain-containing protein, partial [Tanacetum coccineum]